MDSAKTFVTPAAILLPMGILCSVIVGAINAFGSAAMQPHSALGLAIGTGAVIAYGTVRQKFTVSGETLQCKLGLFRRSNHTLPACTVTVKKITGIPSYLATLKAESRTLTVHANGKDTLLVPTLSPQGLNGLLEALKAAGAQVEEI